jgi:hypothetical protein
VNVGDRVRFVKRTQLYLGWPYRRKGRYGTVIAQPYRNVWYVRVDGYPDSNVAVTADLVEVVEP